MSKDVGLKFNACFRPANETRKRYRVLKGGAGSGKSVNIAQDYIVKMMDKRYAGSNLLCVRKVEESNKDSTFAELYKAIIAACGGSQFVDMYWKITKIPLEMECKLTGNKILFRGMYDDRQREKIKSIQFVKGKLTWIWCEEATELDESDVDILDDRLRGWLDNPELYYQITFSFNPISATHWIKKKYFDYQSPDIFTHHSNYLDNAFIDDAYYRRMQMRKDQDPEGYRVYGLGDWGELGGVILTNYRVRPMPPNVWQYDNKALGQDFGFNHANAILELREKDEDLYILREIYEYERDTKEIMEIAHTKNYPKNVLMYCDSAEPDRIKTWRGGGYQAYPVKKDKGSVKAQIDYLKTRHRIYIDPSCTNTIKEIQQWKWKKDDKLNIWLDEPVEFMDDAMAALRYGVEGWRRNTKPQSLDIKKLGIRRA